MKIALITGGLFLISYIAVNRGLGPNPLELVSSVIVVVGFAAGVSWLLRRGRASPRRSAREDLEAEVAKGPPPLSKSSAPPSKIPPSQGRSARKLF